MITEQMCSPHWTTRYTSDSKTKNADFPTPAVTSYHAVVDGTVEPRNEVSMFQYTTPDNASANSALDVQVFDQHQRNSTKHAVMTQLQSSVRHTAVRFNEFHIFEDI